MNTIGRRYINRDRRRLWKLYGWLSRHVGVLSVWLGLIGSAAGQWMAQRPSYLLSQDAPVPSLAKKAPPLSLPKKESIPFLAKDKPVPLLAEDEPVFSAPGSGTSAPASAASCDVPEAPWVPSMSAWANPVSEPSPQPQDTLSQGPGNASGILTPDGSSNPGTGQGDEVLSEQREPAWTPFSVPSPVVAHEAGPLGGQATEAGLSAPVRLGPLVIPIAEEVSQWLWQERADQPKPVCQQEAIWPGTPVCPPEPAGPPEPVGRQELDWQQESVGLQEPTGQKEPGWWQEAIGPQSPLSPPEPTGQKEPTARQLPIRPPERSIRLERIARQAEEHIRRAFELAGRRAYFSARAELLSALELLAQGLDQQDRTQRHSQALARGLAALEEADDFLPSSGGMGQVRDLQTIVAGHTTPVLQGHPWDGLTPMEVLQRYFTYAQEQLALAVGEETAGSAALHGLGKLYAALADQPALSLKAAQAKAMVFYQAALLADPKNYRAANDLGVLLARCGWYQEAQAALAYSLRIHSDPVAWRNLAIVYRQMGQYELALQAAQQWRLLRRQAEAQLSQQTQATDFLVQWVPPEQFAALGNQPPSEGPPPPAGPPDPLPARSKASSGFPASADISPSRISFSQFRENRAGRQQNSAARSGNAFGADPAETPPQQNKPIPFWKSLLAGPWAIFQRSAGSPPSNSASGIGNGGSDGENSPKPGVSSMAGRPPAPRSGRPYGLGLEGEPMAGRPSIDRSKTMPFP